MKCSDIAAISAIAKDAGAVHAVDNTFLTPYYQLPLELGADISIHSTTKYMDGHNATVGGAGGNDDALLGVNYELNNINMSGATNAVAGLIFDDLASTAAFYFPGYNGPYNDAGLATFHTSAQPGGEGEADGAEHMSVLLVACRLQTLEEQIKTISGQGLSPLAIDVDARPEWRLANLIMQRRARWLLSREDDLFLDPIGAGPHLTLPLVAAFGAVVWP